MAKGLKAGHSTGTCAAAAVKAACLWMEGEEDIGRVAVDLPGGGSAQFRVYNLSRRNGEYRAYVFKNAGDDPDATHGLRIGAGVRPAEAFALVAGPGVGIVTRPGLAVSPGKAAINPVPADMIEQAANQATNGCVQVRILVPRGREVAARTFNPRLGIVGGISILGTTGRVRPFSLSAMRETVRLSLSQALAAGFPDIVLVPGNIGRRAAAKHGFDPQQIVEVGNEWAFALKSLPREGIARAVLLGHPGKILKLAGGDFNTHSSNSASALPVLAEKMYTVLGRLPGKEVRTVQGGLEELSDKESRAVFPLLAADVLMRVQGMSSGRVLEVNIVDLSGKELGRARK